MKSAILKLDLPGYADYCRKVATGLFPASLVTRYFSAFSALSAFRSSLSALPSTFG